MKEYSIYCRIKKGKPFFVDTNTNISAVKEKLYEITSYIDDLDIAYFVDNDFFFNSYTELEAERYYCIKEREITDWQKYSKEKEDLKENSKIIYFHNFAK